MTEQRNERGFADSRLCLTHSASPHRSGCLATVNRSAVKKAIVALLSVVN